MSKQSANHGYILFETLVSLLLTGIIIFGVLPQTLFLFQKNHALSEAVILYQVLYSETARNCRLEQVPKQLEKEQISFQIKQEANQVKAEVAGYGEKITVSREF